MTARKSPNKVGLIGTGMVGASFAYSLMQRRVANELVLIDANAMRAEGEMMDLNHSMPFVHPMRIIAGGYPHLDNAEVIVVCAGIGQRPGQMRLELFKLTAFQNSAQNLKDRLNEVSGVVDESGELWTGQQFLRE